ncbi:hypothetical protein EC968_005313 [Mortierella alpina]|nr:hypothetical protein EC968_005313 [Mortierella alpina]
MDRSGYTLLPTADGPAQGVQTRVVKAAKRRLYLTLLFSLTFLCILAAILFKDPIRQWLLYTRKYHLDAMKPDVDRLVAGSLESSIVWDRLAEMTDTYGPRLVGSEALEKSIDWIVDKVKEDNLSVTTEDVVVDYWQRHEESLHFLSPTRGPLKMHILGLGYSVSTPDPVRGLEAEIIVAHSKEELVRLGEAGQIKGRIVLWNQPYRGYGKDVLFRASGALWAQEYGASASLVRSLGPLSLQTPHTGGAWPADIPMASISAEDADLLERSLERHLRDPTKFKEWPRVRLIMGATTERNARVSRNIIIELKGRERPEEIVVVGGHIDSWDVGAGAVDDGAGCFIAWETIRQLSLLGRPPRRTVRVVFWTSEESTSVGGVVYAKNHPESDSGRHVFAFESDAGVFDPYGIAYSPGRDSQKDAFEVMTHAGSYFLGGRKDLGYTGAGHHVLPNGEGADIDPLCKQGVGCAMFTPADPFPLPYPTSPYATEESIEAFKRLEQQMRRGSSREDGRRPVDSGYYYYHHTDADTMGVFTPDQLKRSAAAMAIWTYIAAEVQIEL